MRKTLVNINTEVNGLGKVVSQTLQGNWLQKMLCVNTWTIQSLEEAILYSASNYMFDCKNEGGMTMINISCTDILHTWWWLTITPWFLKVITHKVCHTAISIWCARAIWNISEMLSFSALYLWFATSCNCETSISQNIFLPVANLLRNRTW